MFVFSLLPFSTSLTKFLNGDQEDIILYVNRVDSFSNCIKTVISLTLEIDQNKNIILWILLQLL